jgi:quercetin dioxygenase-like cupin family protein
MRRTPIALVATLLALAACSKPAAQAATQPATATAQPAQPAMAPMEDMTMKAVVVSSLQYNPIQPDGWAPGLTFAVVSGDPSKAGAPYVLRLRLPDGYKFPPHYHPNTENLTVLKGTFMLENGDVATDNMKTYQPGDFLYLPGMHPHYGAVKGDTEVQLHGMGPFEIKNGKPPAA